MARRGLSLRSKMFVAIGAVIGMAFFALEWTDYSNVKKDSMDDLVAQATLVRAFVMATRRVYHHQFLESGIELTDKTVGFLPAVALAKISKELKHWNASGTSFNNVSDRPRNVNQRADKRELEIMERFRRNPKLDRVAELYIDDQGREMLQYAKPVWVEKYCLKCHGPKSGAPSAIRARYDTAYDYKVGELRGVLSIRLPAQLMSQRAKGHFWTTLIITSVTFLAVFVLIALLISHFGARPLTLVSSAMERVATQSGPVPEIDRAVLNGEFALMRRCFNEMLERIDGEKAKLESMARRYQALAEGTSAIPWVVDTEAQCVHYFGPQIAALLGYAAETWKNLEVWSLRIHEDDRARVTAAMCTLGDHSLEYRLLGADGKERWVQSLANVDQGEAQNHNLVGVLIDISARKENEILIMQYSMSQARLLREVNHRVRNNLTSLMGLARLEDHAVGEGAGMQQTPLRSFEQRLAGLLRVHEMLSETKWEPLKLSALCSQLLATTVQSYGPSGMVAVDVGESDVKISADQAHHLALVCSELTVNSMKHAQIDGGETHVGISIERHDGQIKLVYSDNGEGFPEDIVAGNISGSSVGLGLIRGIVAHSLRGTITLRNDDGAVTELTFPETETKAS
jgi:PAS domain S-box-containing protein